MFDTFNLQSFAITNNGSAINVSGNKAGYIVTIKKMTDSFSFKAWGSMVQVKYTGGKTCGYEFACRTILGSEVNIPFCRL